MSAFTVTTTALGERRPLPWQTWSRSEVQIRITYKIYLFNADFLVERYISDKNLHEDPICFSTDMS